MRRTALLTLCLLLTSTAFAQGFGLPPGKWWKIPRVVKMLDLTQEQQDELDDVFRSSAPDLIDLKAELEKATIELREALDQTEVDREQVRRAAKKINAARSSLFERELMLLVDMRRTLTEKQWNELRRALDERQRGMQDRRPPDRRGPPPPNPPRDHL